MTRTAEPTRVVHLDPHTVTRELAEASSRARAALTPAQWAATVDVLDAMPAGVGGDRARLMLVRVRLARLARNLPLVPRTAYLCRSCQDAGVVVVTTDPQPHGTVHPCHDCRPVTYWRWRYDHLGCTRPGCPVCAKADERAGAAPQTTVQDTPDSWVR